MIETKPDPQTISNKGRKPFPAFSAATPISKVRHINNENKTYDSKHSKQSQFFTLWTEKQKISMRFGQNKVVFVCH